MCSAPQNKPSSALNPADLADYHHPVDVEQVRHAHVVVRPTTIQTYHVHLVPACVRAYTLSKSMPLGDELAQDAAATQMSSQLSRAVPQAGLPNRGHDM